MGRITRWSRCAGVCGAGLMLTACGSLDGRSAATTVVINQQSAPAEQPQQAAPAAQSPATVTVTAPAATPTQAEPAPAPRSGGNRTSVDFPTNAQPTCMTADYGSRVPITDPGLRTQQGYRTTCGFAERVASVLRAGYHTHPGNSTYRLGIYSSTLDRNLPITCTVAAGLATCRADGYTEHVYVTTADLSLG